MIQISFLNAHEQVTVPVQKFTTSNSTNSVYLYFESDAEARDNEEVLKQHGFKTSHTEGVVRIHNFNDFDVVIPA